MAVRQYSELLAWQTAKDLVEEVCNITKRFPREEVYGLSSQLRRAAVSVPSNIAEGQSRGSRDFVRYLSIAQGSLSESETQVLIAVRLGYLDSSESSRFVTLASEVGRLIHGLSKSIQKRAAEQ